MSSYSRCPICKGITGHLITSVTGKRLYRCSNSVTVLRKNGKELVVGQGETCGTVIDDTGRIFDGHVAFTVFTEQGKEQVEVLAIHGKLK